MKDLSLVDDKRLNRGMQLLRDEIIKRGWTARLAYEDSPHCFIDRGDGKPLHIFSTTPPTTSYAAAHAADDKYATYQLLKENGIRQLRTVLVIDNSHKEAVGLLNELGVVVVKPVDGGHGKGITVNVSTEDALEKAITYAKEHTKSSSRVIVQEQYAHSKMHDIRIACIDGKFIGAIWRKPANVMGDGVSTVRQLIERENATESRGVAYYAPLATIDTTQAEKFLGASFEYVPKQGEEVQVIGVANYGAGGETIDVTDDIPDWMRQEAEMIAVASGLYVCGIDYMTAHAMTPTSRRDDIDAVVIEINKCPSLAIHDLPTSGKSRGAVAAYVEYLSRIPSAV